VSAKRRFRPRSEWARLAGAVAMTAGWFVAITPVGWVLAHVSDAIGRLR